jgi:hypothetical protein
MDSHGDEHIASTKRRATGDLVSSADRVDSGFGEDTGQRRQHAARLQQVARQRSHYQDKQEHAQTKTERRTVVVPVAQQYLTVSL